MRFQINDEQNWASSGDGELREIMQTRMLGALIGGEYRCSDGKLSNWCVTDELHMMEASGLLDPLNKIHLLSLHLVLFQRINQSMELLLS